jgi:hypothetical protein
LNAFIPPAVAIARAIARSHIMREPLFVMSERWKVAVFGGLQDGSLMTSAAAVCQERGELHGEDREALTRRRDGRKADYR